MTKYRVAHVTTAGMSLRYLLMNQLLSLREAGYEVVGVSAPGPGVSTLVEAGIRHIPVSMTRTINPLADLLALWQLYRIFQRERFTIVHTHTPKAGLLGQVAAHMARVPIIVNTVHGFYFHARMHPALQQVYICLETIAARYSDVLLSQNNEDVQTAIAERICPADKIRFLGNGIDIGRFSRASVDRSILDNLRLSLGIPLHTPVVGFVGRLVVEKGILELLAAARVVLQSLPSARFLIIGPQDDGKPDSLSPEIAVKYDVADACVFTGMREDVPELMALMNVFVLPSHREGFPRTPMEASAMEVPCIVTDIRGCRETVVNDRTGILVPVGDVEAIAGAIIRLLSDTGLSQRMGRQGRNLAVERFDEQLVFTKVKDAYSGLLQQKKLM